MSSRFRMRVQIPPPLCAHPTVPNTAALASTRIEELIVAVPVTNPPTSQVSCCQPSPTQLCDAARLPEAIQFDPAPMCAVGLEIGGSDLSVPCMSCCLNSSLTVDQLVSPQQGGANQQLDGSVIIQIEDEEDDIAPPCTMELDTAMHECSLQDSEAQIPSTPSATNCEGPPRTDASPQSAPDEISGCGPPREQDSPYILDIILGAKSSYKWYRLGRRRVVG
ncbi:hypothetical protein TNIN_207001 [Trichonephila inaurata madagascariensis]|uniref:Uncharacterized protein n=1 Tax=Trichonephila inaurata madagascariensis TaxID=2747483 RepID=A0A8X6XLS4_9ARAC|nr:hypothetical protein TNIN_207001 [Trichonephila inaurata madagascariensis]